MAHGIRLTRGLLGERIAATHLVRAGYEIVATNFRTRFGELDLIAADERCIVFCEVKTRVAEGSSGPASPLDAIGPAKRRQVRRMAKQWLAETAGGHPHREGLRFDAIGVTLSPRGAVLELEHVEDAF
jgi:putative endonuclease